MDKTIVNVASELKNIGKEVFSCIECDLPKLELSGREFAAASPIRVEFTRSYDGEALLVQGTISTDFSEHCARCGKSYIMPFYCDFSERVVRKGSSITDAKEFDDDSYVFMGETFDMETLIRETILLNMPMYSVCREDCKGVCSVCGCDLNVSTCECKSELIEYRSELAKKLREILSDNEEDNG